MITKDSIVFNVCSKHCMKNVELEQFIIIDTAITSILCKKKINKNKPKNKSGPNSNPFSISTVRSS